MDRDFRPVIVPLGPRMRLMALRLLGAKRARLDWLAASDGVSARMSALVASGSGSRHGRVEVDGRVLGDEPGSAGDEGPVEPFADGEAERLPAVVRERLKSHVGIVADSVRIHADERAHRIAVDHRADAVASGADVYFRRSRYQPHDEAGFALLAHEATHVSHARRPHASWQRPMLRERDAEEAVAIAVERGIRHSAAQSQPAVPVAAVATTPPTRSQTMTAATDRSLDTAPQTPPIDMERLRQLLARDLMRQIRAEMERGG